MDAQQIKKSCDRFLMGHYRQSPKQVLIELANNTSPETAADIYGTGPLN